MDIEWELQSNKDHELTINGTHMGWVSISAHVHCMWMAYDVEQDGRQHMIQSQYPENHKFDTVEQAKAALLESAVPVYIGGFRGR